MLEEMLGFAKEGDAAFIVLSAAVGTGLLIRLLLGFIYGRYIYAMNEAGITRVKWIVKMRERFREQYRLGLQVRDLDAFVRKNVFQISFLRVFLITWEKLGMQTITVCAIAAVTGALQMLFAEMNAAHIVSYLVCGLAGTGILLFAESVADVPGKRYILLNSTRDYLGNIALPAILAELQNEEPEPVGVLMTKNEIQPKKSEKRRRWMSGNKESRGEREKNEAMRLVREARAERSRETVRREIGEKSGSIQPTAEDVNEILKEFLA